MGPNRSLRLLCLAATVLVSGGCVGAEVAAPLPPGEGGTVPLGALPGPPSDMTMPPVPTAPPSESSVPTTTVSMDPVAVPLASDGDRTTVLLVGDTAMAATAERATDSMCGALTDDGWTVRVEAERGRTVEFGGTVLDAVLGDPPTVGGQWDVVGLMFGHHLSDAMVDDLDGVVADRFAEALAALVDRIGNRPVVLYTVVESDPEQAGIDDAIRALAATRPNVVVVDWAAAVAADPDLVVDGGPLPDDDGADVLADLTAEVFGSVQDGESGACVPATFVDDSAIVL